MWLMQGIYAYVTLDEGVETSEELRKELINAVRNEIGAFGERGCGFGRAAAARGCMQMPRS
jgi:hypothetical protein